MRITNALFYNNSLSDYQRNMQELYKVNQQLSSGREIQHSFEDSGKYVDTMRLDYEIETLDQVKETSSKAQTFANNTDKTLNQMTDILNQFKTKLIQAGNQANSSTSLNALANDMEAMLINLKAIGNTSINGQYLFSGSALNVKPIAADGSYNGNSQKLEAIIGSGVEVPYNIDGQDLFLGSDSDYNRVVSTNVKMYNQSKLNPDIMVLNSGVTTSEEVYLSANDTIRDMVGDFDTDATNDPKAVFYVSGKRSDGESFSDKIAIDTSSKVSDLLEGIGLVFGNDSRNKVVDVTLNDYGQIEVKDLDTGSLKLEMNIFGAVDRNAPTGSSGSAEALNLDQLMIQDNIQIIEFQKSNFSGFRAVGSVSTSQRVFSPGEFEFGSPLQQTNGEPVTESTRLRDFMGKDLDAVTFSVVDNSGTALVVNDFPNPGPLTNNDTVQNLLGHIETEFGVVASLEDNGQIVLKTGGTTDFSANQFRATMTAVDNTISNEIQSFEITSNAPLVGGAGTITLSNANFAAGPYAIAVADGDNSDTIAENIRAAINGDANIASVVAQDGKIIIEYVNAVGDIPDTDLTIVNTSGAANSTNITENNYSASRTVNAFSLYDGMNLSMRGFEKDGNELLSNVSQVIRATNEYATENTKLSEVAGVQTLNGQNLTFDFVDRNGNFSKGQIQLKDSGSQFMIDYNADGIFSPDEMIPLFDGEGEATPASEVTYRQVADVMAFALNRTQIQDGDNDGDLFSEYMDALKNTKSRIEVSMDDKGRWRITDKFSSESPIEMMIYDEKAKSFSGLSNEYASLSFMANDAIKIDDPSIDFYSDLQDIIDQVRLGEFTMSADNKDPRSLGLNNSITKIDHLMDHVNKAQTKIGSYSNALMSAQERSELLSVNVQTVRSEIIDVDMAEAYLKFQQISNAYQASLSTISKINSMSLLNYM